jgi:general secretion pathway protein K
MTHAAKKSRQGGFILVVVLGIILMLSVLLLSFNGTCRANLRSADTFESSAQALNTAKAGLNIAIAAIRDDNDVTSIADSSDDLAAKYTFDIDDTHCSVTITEENGRLNINTLKGSQGTLNRPAVDLFLRLIDTLNKPHSTSLISYGIVPAIIDWIDLDGEITSLPFINQTNLGAESDYYTALAPPYDCGNGPLNILEELLLIKGVTPDVFNRLRNVLTVYGDGKININTAPEQVILSLSENMDQAVARVLIERRKFEPFETIEEIKALPGITDDIYKTIEAAAVAKPANRYYRVASLAAAGSTGWQITAILRKNMANAAIDVILYQEFQAPENQTPALTSTGNKTWQSDV